MDFGAICVPTPLDAHQQLDISYVKTSSEEFAKHLTKGTVVVLESSTSPVTTEELVNPILEKKSGLLCGTDFNLGFSPECVAPGNITFNTKSIPKVVGVFGKDTIEVIATMYRTVLEGAIHEVSSPAVSEMKKILENTYHNINIGLVNEICMVCKKMGI